MPRSRSLSSNEKLGLGVVVAIGLTTLVFGVFQLNRAIYLPLERKEGPKFKTPEQIREEQEQRLKETDTDEDGLSDYDELHLFRTSPFLADSDSDGVNDGEEVAKSSDPNCPSGKTCRQVSVASAQGTGLSGDSGSVPTLTEKEAAVLEAMETAFGDITDLTPEAMAERISEMTSDELVDFLAKLGLPREQLEETDDEELRKTLIEALTEVSPEEGLGAE